MIHWDKIGWFNRPSEWDESPEDGVYGDIEEFLDSCDAGEQGMLYLLRRSHQGDALAKLTGPTPGDPRIPEALPEIEPEEDSDANP